MGRSGLHHTQEKIKAAVGAPPPQKVSQLRSFTGLINPSRRFLPHLASDLQPLNQPLEKNRRRCWTRRRVGAVRRSKTAHHFGPGPDPPRARTPSETSMRRLVTWFRGGAFTRPSRRINVCVKDIE